MLTSKFIRSMYQFNCYSNTKDSLQWEVGREIHKDKRRKKDMRAELSEHGRVCFGAWIHWINFNFIALQFNSNLFAVPLGGLPNCHRLQRFFTSSNNIHKMIGNMLMCTTNTIESCSQMWARIRMHSNKLDVFLHCELQNYIEKVHFKSI